MTTSPRVVFFGNERLVSGLQHTETPILRGLIEHEYNIVAIVVNDRDAMSRNARTLEVAELAKEHPIPVLSPAKLSDIEQELHDLQPDMAILAAYGRIIPQRIIDIFMPIGIINIHPSLLPHYRGSTPIESAILHGDTTTGVSIMQLTAGMDEGPIFVQQSVELSGYETKFELYERLSQLGSKMLLEALPHIISGQTRPIPQRTDGVTYTTPLMKSDGMIDPSTDTAVHIERKVRAYLGFPKSRVSYHGNDVIITSARVVEKPIDDALCVNCKQNSTLLVESLIAPSGKLMSGDAYLRGLR